MKHCISIFALLLSLAHPALDLHAEDAHGATNSVCSTVVDHCGASETAEQHEKSGHHPEGTDCQGLVHAHACSHSLIATAKVTVPAVDQKIAITINKVSNYLNPVSQGLFRPPASSQL